MKHCTWGLGRNHGRDSGEIDPSVNKEDSLKIEDKGLSCKIDMMIPKESIVKIQDQDTIDIDQQEGKITKHSMIDRNQRTSQDHQPLLDVFDVDVIDIYESIRIPLG